MTQSTIPRPDRNALPARVLACAHPALLHEMTRPWSPGVGETIVAAVSGGADSVALACLLAGLAPGRGWRIVVATLDHGLRGGRGADDRAFVERLAAALGLPCLGERRAVDARPERSAETAARVVRRTFLREAARASGASVVALGHTADDQAETVLFRLARGSGTAGLGGMRRLAGRFWRPLRDVRRAELRALLASAGVAWREDETNGERTSARNRIRLDVLPALERALGPGSVPAIVRAASLAREDEAHLAREAARWLGETTEARGDGTTSLDRRGLAGLPVPLARRVVRSALGRHVPGSRLSARHVLAVLELARASGPGTRVDLPGGASAERRGGRIDLRGPGDRSPGDDAR